MAAKTVISNDGDLSIVLHYPSIPEPTGIVVLGDKSKLLNENESHSDDFQTISDALHDHAAESTQPVQHLEPIYFVKKRLRQDFEFGTEESSKHRAHLSLPKHSDKSDSYESVEVRSSCDDG